MFKKKLLSILASEKIRLISQLVLGGIFVYAAVGKILHPGDFMTAVRNYKILPASLVSIAAYALPWIEFAFGCLLILNIKARFSAAVLSVLLLVFIGAISSALIRGINIECGCFLQNLHKKETAVSSGVFLLVRDILFLLPGIVIIFFTKPGSKPVKWADETMDGGKLAAHGEV